jgi:hypothetical protein
MALACSRIAPDFTVRYEWPTIFDMGGAYVAHFAMYVT